MRKPEADGPGRSPIAATSPPPSVRYDVTLLSPGDLPLFNEGSHCRLYQALGAHPLSVGGEDGTYWRP